MNNLIICHTPLQCLLAQRIIQLYPQHTFEMVAFSFTDTPKIRHYFTQTATLCHKSQIIWLNNQSPLHYLHQLHSLSKKNNRYDFVFVASIDASAVHAILSNIQYKHLMTFDDGTANIIEGSVLRTPKHYNLQQKIMRFVCGIHLNMEEIRTRSEGHYTLYPQLSNITKPLIPIQLFNFKKDETNETQEKQEIRILLGQPFLDSPDENAAIFQKLAKTLQIDLYCPHPRENQPLKHIKTLQTDLIIEDYVAQYLQKNPHQILRIYTLFSTAALNLHNIPRVKIKAIYPKHPFFRQPHIQKLYQLMQQQGIHIQEITP